ncbi:MAG: hypothetical protein AMXMBFR13_18490 [Phycisphaerae bacterium]
METILYCPACGRPMTVPAPLPPHLQCPHCSHLFTPKVPATPQASPVPAGYARPVREGVSPKSRLLAGLLGVFLGGLGAHRFYLGFPGVAFLQILVTTVSFLLCLRIHGYTIGFIWGFVEGVLLLAGRMRDSKGRPVLEW